MIEAPSSRAEAGAISLALRDAAENGLTAALITPDRLLVRQVIAALDRWKLIPNDSAGQPLPLFAPGRLLRHIAVHFEKRLTAEGLLTLLKHPLTNTGSKMRRKHLRFTGRLELELRRNGPPFPTAEGLRNWVESDETKMRKRAAGHQDTELFGRIVQEHKELSIWVDWIASQIDKLHCIGKLELSAFLQRHLEIAESLAAGPDGQGSGKLWKKKRPARKP